MSDAKLLDELKLLRGRVQSLLERLHDKASNDHVSRACDFADLLTRERLAHDATRAEVSSLTAENERLREQVAIMEGAVDGSRAAYRGMEKELERAMLSELSSRAEVERLRKERDEAREAHREADAWLADSMRRQFAAQPVLDLVKAIIEHQQPGRPAGLEWERRRDDLWTSLVAAVDTYETAREGA